MLKAKVFMCSRPQELEDELNKWFQKNSQANVKLMSQSIALDPKDPGIVNILVTLCYSED
jgi:hypothetical protein